MSNQSNSVCEAKTVNHIAISVSDQDTFSSGELLIQICADEHLPTVRRVTQWLRENPELPSSTRSPPTTGWPQQASRRSLHQAVRREAGR
jgi:hypothetical protein